ncbi:hypothetical protein RHS01_07561 [Rhizoctonia solani]|uniref:Uncharacterized protein n=1 Tax=Rhizoctonia solani TaxID=456999 RepID=A0A8H7M3A8_9AGAM|nr:hypothetical protein RHS01_07561 [Rhizoctonia solani]
MIESTRASVRVCAKRQEVAECTMGNDASGEELAGKKAEIKLILGVTAPAKRPGYNNVPAAQFATAFDCGKFATLGGWQSMEMFGQVQNKAWAGVGSDEDEHCNVPSFGFSLFFLRVRVPLLPLLDSDVWLSPVWVGAHPYSYGYYDCRIGCGRAGCNGRTETGSAGLGDAATQETDCEATELQLDPGTLDIQKYIGYGNLDIYLFHADSRVEAFKWSNVSNDSNWVGVSVNDSFWGTRGVTGWRDGQNQSMPFYFVATDAGAALTAANPARQRSLRSAMSASSLSAIASASSAAATASATPGAGSNGTGSLQNGGGDSSFPKWAIALLVILGILALAALMLLAWFSARNLRTRQRRRQSTGSSTPIMGLPASQAPPESTISPIEHPRPLSSVVLWPISGQDAAIMASAFRAMLRKPDFASRPEEEDESPEERNVRDMKEQLAEEGRDIQSVRSERGVRVHNTAEDGSEDGWGRPTTPRR